MTKLEKLVLQRANSIIEAWWYEDIWEFAGDHDLTDEEMEELLKIPFNIELINNINDKK